MKNTDNKNSWLALRQIYVMMFRNWIYVVGGIITMILYASMNGVSITMVVPVLDLVFKPRTTPIVINNLPEMYQSLVNRLATFFSNEFHLTNLDSLKTSTILNDLKVILTNTDPYTVLMGISIFVIVIFLLKNIFFYANKLMFTNLRGRTVRDIRNYMYTKYLSQSLAFFNTNRIGDSLVRMVNDVDIVSIEFISNLFIFHRFYRQKN
jgi:ABC-type multidrug transport system fused ATPase/permease subunit